MYILIVLLFKEYKDKNIKVTRADLKLHLTDGFQEAQSDDKI